MGHLGGSQGAGWCRRRKGWGYTTLSWLLYCDAQTATEAATGSGLGLYLLVRTPWIPFLHPLVNIAEFPAARRPKQSLLVHLFICSPI